MKKKILIAILVVSLLAMVFVGCADKNNVDSKAIIKNGSFDMVSEDNGEILNWKKSDKGTFKFPRNNNDGSDNYNPALGTGYAYISTTSNSNASDYIYQPVKLQANKYYKLTAFVNVEKITASNKIGARVGFLEDKTFEGLNVAEVTGGWKTFEYYFQSTTSKEMTLIVTLGSKTEYVQGSVGFDNVKVEKVDKVPADYTGVVGSLKDSSSTSLGDGMSIAFVIIFTILSFAIAYCLYFVLRKHIAGEKELVPTDDTTSSAKMARALTSPFAYFIYILLAAFFVRFIALLTTYGFGKNVNALEDIGVLISKNGFLSIMAGKSGVNQPIGVVYLMAALGNFAKWIGIEYGSLGYSILVRMPAIIADVFVVFAIYSFGQKHCAEKSGQIFSAIYAIVPIFFIFGSIYGSLQSIAIAFLIVMFIKMLEKSYVASGIYFTIALLFSNWALLVLPIILAYQIYQMVVTKESRVPVAITMAGSFLLFYALAIAPCWAEVQAGNILFPFKQMLASFKSQAFVTVDTFNLYAIFGGVNKTTRNTALEIFNWAFVIAMAGGIIYNMTRSNSKSVDTLLLSAVMIIAYSTLGAQSTLEILPIGLALLLVYIMIVNDRRLFGCFAGLAGLSFLNIAQLLSINGSLSNSESGNYIAFMSNDAFMIVFSVLAVALTFYTLYVAVDIVAYNKTDDIPPLERKMKDELKYICSFAWAKKSK
ncbi:MAG: hypothetical protein RR416_00025 [Clostridia bacterium]